VEIQVTIGGRGDRAARIYRHLRDAILDGRLRAGERLPPTRELAATLQVSRGTVATAYDRLTGEGLIVGMVGSGTFVADGVVVDPRGRRAPAGAQVRPRRHWPAGVTSAVGAIRFDFRVGWPDPALFPLADWRRMVTAELGGNALRTAEPADPAGLPGLRTAIARYVGVARSVRAGTEDVVVTDGAQQALDLIGRVLIDPGVCVAVEEPGYPPARELFASLGARVVGVPVDEHGLVVDALPPAARLVYCTPSHQFPTGVTLSAGRRVALLEWARRRGAAIIEDDYDSEFRHADRPLEPVAALDRAGRVLYVGSFSKTLLPALRQGFVVAPASLRPALLAARRLTDGYGDPTTQGALARLLDDGLLARHVRRAGRAYSARHAAVEAALRGPLAPWWEPVRSVAGLHLTARARTVIDVDAVVVGAAAAGVAVEDLGRYCAGPPQAGLVIGVGLVPLDRIAEGLRRLTAVCEAVAPLATAGHPRPAERALVPPRTRPGTR
jgi:GntR family transcriptional regulator / MocR family aminotransferase